MAKKALVIAIRYAVVRKQFASAKGQPENSIMDYQTHQYKLINLLASTFAMQLTGLQIRKVYENLLVDLDKTSPSSPKMAATLDNLKEIHATSAGMKAMCTWKTLDMIEQCRQSCGGFGYLAYANLSAMYQDHAVQCTWEGDNTVLTLQTGRYLVGCLRDLKKGKTLPKGVGYLNGIPSLLSKSCGARDVGQLEVIQEAFDVTCANLVLQVGKAVEEYMSKGIGQDEALEKTCKLLNLVT
jgi:acyl-CoA oxidase